MTREEALIFSKNNLVAVKLDWWSDFMYIYYCPGQKKYLSGADTPINLKFLSDGNYTFVDNVDKHLGGLFAI